MMSRLAPKNWMYTAPADSRWALKAAYCIESITRSLSLSKAAILLIPLATLTALSTLSPSAMARAPLYGALDHPELLNCDTLYWQGEQTQAANCYQTLTRNIAMPPQIRAEAMWAMGDVHTANNLFQAAVQSVPDDADIRLRWGSLFLQTYQYQDALDLFNEALSIAPENSYAHVGIVAALNGSDPELINEHLDAVMNNFAAPAGAKLQAMLLLLKASMQRDRFDEATDMLKDINELVEEHSLPNMEVSAYSAALAFMTRQDYQPYIDASLAESPTYGDAWAILGYFATITRRYREGGEFFTKAVEVQPNLWSAHVELGQNHLRLNHVQEAVDHIRLSYEGDPFNPTTVNLLRLLDTYLDDFVTLNYPNPPVDAFPELILKLHRDEQDILEHYARALSEQSIAQYRERYRFEPKEPIVVEIYPNHEDFVVRSIGMPGVGILGVTFGYLFAMDSPSGHPEASYHWGTTLWHEMAHVFTVEATEHGVPRWYSEGVSVYEEWQTGPTPGRKIPIPVLAAMAEGKFLSVAELDDGFMRPSYENQVIVTYMQSGLVFEFINEAFGHDYIVDMLYLFNDGTHPEVALESTLGISIAEFDNRFEDFIEREFGDFLPHLDTWQQHHANSFSALQNGDFNLAIQEAQSAIFIYPDYAEVDSPYVALARAYSQLGDHDNEFLALQSFWQIGGYSPRALMTLGDAYVAREELNKAEAVYNAINWADPFDEALHSKLGDLYIELDKPEQAITEYKVLLALDPIDKATANYQLANALFMQGDNEQSMDYLMSALDIAPQYRPAQRLLLELSRQ